jgi:NitT/TauT family transport system permease protein
MTDTVIHQPTSTDYRGALEGRGSSLEDALAGELKAAKRRAGVAVWGVRVTVVVAVIAAWHFAVKTELTSEFVASTPADVGRSLRDLVMTANLWSNVWSTFSAAFLALLIGGAIGIGFATLTWRVAILDRAFRPFLTLFNAMPRPALAPVFILWFGFGQTPKVLVAITLVFFLTVLSTHAGLQGVSKDILLLANSLGISAWKRFRLVELPSAIPSIAAGLRLGAVYSVLGVVVSEMVGAYSGLGQMLVKSTNGFNMAETFATILLLGVLSVLLDLAVGLFERKVGGRRASAIPR